MATAQGTTQTTAHGLASSLLAGVGGATLGGSLSWLAVSVVPWFDNGALGAVPIGLTTIVAGCILGLVVGPGAIATRRPAVFVLLQASRAVVLVTTVWALAAFITGRTNITAELEILAGYAFLMAFALPLGLPLSLPVAAISTAVLRFAARRPAPGVILVIAVFGAGCSIAVIRPDLSEGIGDLLTSPSSRDELRWTVANRSTNDLVLGIWTRELDGYGGSTMDVVACRITTGSDEVGASWFVSLDREEPIDTDPIPVAEAADMSVPRTVWLEVAPDGRVTGTVGREPPSVEATLEDACGPVVAP